MTISRNREQRWIDWKNGDDTTCPPFGCIELYDYEVVGQRIVLLGRAATVFDLDYTAEQGASWKHVFNNHCEVQAGGYGLCTFDLPTWAACLGTVSNPNTFGRIATFGLFLVDGATVEIGEPWKIEVPPIGLLDDVTLGSVESENAGWNTYYKHPSLTNVWYVGGLRTFTNEANTGSG